MLLPASWEDSWSVERTVIHRLHWEWELIDEWVLSRWGPLVASAVVRLAVLASGGGTILSALFEEGLPVSLVLADRPCGALGIAEAAGVAAELVHRKSYGRDFDRDGYTTEVVDALLRHRIDLVAMAGFGTILGQAVHDAFGGNILNTHPALLPSFPGWHPVEAALAYGVKVTGCTVHVATLEVDAGPILAQEAVPVIEGDTAESLHERIKVVERRLYPATIREVLERGSVQ
jgi:phosphoribosylglycinamide formyltransferase-1